MMQTGHGMETRSSMDAPVRVADTRDGGFAERIRTLIRKYGGVSHVAQLCGFSEGVVRSWRDGRSDPSRTRCIALARGLDVSLSWLVSGEGPMIETRPGAARDDTPAPAVDAHRLFDAMRVLQSTLQSTGNTLSLEARAQLLSEYYGALSDPDPVARAEGFGEIHKHLMERIRQANGHP